MKREVRRKHVTMTPAEKARWQQAVREEQAAKGANIAHAQELRRRTTEVRAELTRVAELLKQERQAQGVSLSELQERTGSLLGLAVLV